MFRCAIGEISGKLYRGPVHKNCPTINVTIGRAFCNHFDSSDMLHIIRMELVEHGQMTVVLTPSFWEGGERESQNNREIEQKYSFPLFIVVVVASAGNPSCECSPQPHFHENHNFWHIIY